MSVLQRMTYADFLALPNDGMLHELVRGEILQMPPPKGDHAGVEAILVGAISRYLRERAVALEWQPSAGRESFERLVGYLASGEAGMRYALPDDPDQIRGADVLYLDVEQVSRLSGLFRTEYIPEAPALVVEVISPSETASYSNEKVTDYLTAGAREVWQVFPTTRTVRVFRSDGTTFTVPAGGILAGSDVLPGFSLALTELFYQ